MAVIPKRTKYRRPHRLPYDGLAKGNTELHFGEYGLQASCCYDSLYETWRKSLY